MIAGGKVFFVMETFFIEIFVQRKYSKLLMSNFPDFQIAKSQQIIYKKISFGNVEDKIIKVFCGGPGQNGRSLGSFLVH